jgi:uncharacterized protein YfaP (DUF2135 family)
MAREFAFAGIALVGVLGCGRTVVTSGPCGDALDCPVGEACFEDRCVGAGRMRFSLAWEVVTDLDLHVLTPAGYEIYFDNPSEGGATLDVDDCVHGGCADLYGVHVENIFLSDDALPGVYQVWIVNFDGRNDSSWRLEIVGEGMTRQEQDALPAIEGTSSERYETTLD